MSIHELRLRVIKRKLGLPEDADVAIENPNMSNLRNEIPKDPSDSEPEKPVPWEAPEYYTSIKDFNEDMHDLLDSFADDSGKVEYGSKQAILNVRRLFQNVGELYVEKAMYD